MNPSRCRDCHLVPQDYWDDENFRSPSLDRLFEGGAGSHYVLTGDYAYGLPLSAEYILCPEHRKSEGVE